MAFLPSLQEAMQPHTGGVLFFRTERIQDKGSETSASSDLPIVRLNSLELGHSWGRKNAFEYSSLLKSVTRETKVPSYTILYEPLQSKISSGEDLWRTWSSYALFSPFFFEKQQIGRWESTSITWQFHSKVHEGYYRFVLDLQDLFTVGLATCSQLIEVQPLEQLYDFRKPEEVSHFLEVNPFLTPLLREAYTHIKRHFLSSKLFLEVVADPEAIDEEQLVIFIATDLDPDQATESLDRLDDEWWLDALEYARGKLCITLEFQ